MQIPTIEIHLSSYKELEHYCLIFEYTIYQPRDCIINNQEKKYLLILEYNGDKKQTKLSGGKDTER